MTIAMNKLMESINVLYDGHYKSELLFMSLCKSE